MILNDLLALSYFERIAHETRYRFNDLYTKQVLRMRCASSCLFSYVNL